jgi:uncharacterized protein YdhG (YjbR/CyaY superfamily)
MEEGDKKSTKKPAKVSKGFTDQERAAMRERAREQKMTAGKADGESDVLAKIAEMSTTDRVLAEQLHALIMASAPTLSPKTWYGMPAYTKDGQIICHFQPAEKFKTRYPTLGFSDKANLDDGDLWPVAFALNEFTSAVKEKIVALLKKAVN